ncbi:MAG: LysR family transcriptional regulator [Ruminococcaceae bacterium]|nr:LysR family transcriptional regulator [Oscillospiraceae bacterium]
MLTIPEQYFLVVAETGSFSRAAQQLYVSQSSVSKHISQMENELGFLLLERTTRSVRLTPQGKIIYDTLRDEVKTWEIALEAARSLHGELQGTLRLGLMHGWCIARLPTGVFDSFQQRYPQVDITIEKNTQKGAVARLRGDALDLILTTVQEIQEYPDLDYCRAFHVPVILQISATHPLAATAKSAEDLNGMNAYLLSTEASAGSIRFFEDVAASEGWNFNIVPCPNHETIMTAVAQNKGCTLIGQASAASHSPKYRCFETGHIMRMVYAWNAGTPSRIVEAFLNECTQPPAPPMQETRPARKPGAKLPKASGTEL